MQKKHLLIFITVLFLNIYPLKASEISQIRYLKAVVLDKKLYLIDNSGNLAISKFETLETKIFSIPEIVSHLPIIGYSTMSNPKDTHLFWDVGVQGLYVTQQSDNPFTTIPIIKIPIAATFFALDDNNSSNETKYDATNITVDIGYFESALALKRIGIPFLASLYVTPNTTCRVWVSQGDVLTKWVSTPSRSSLPKSSGLSLIPLPEERKLNTNITLPYIAFYDKGITYIVNVNGKVRQFPDNLFVEEQSYQHDRISPAIPPEKSSIPDSPVILVLNKDTAKPSWLRFVVQDGIAHIASENNGMTSANVAVAKNISNALNKALKALGEVEWRVDDIPAQSKKKEKPEVVPKTSPPPTQTLLWKELPDSKVEGVGLRVKRGRTPLKRIPEGFEKPKETLVPPPPGYLYWAEYHRWDDGFGYVSHYVLWKKELDTQDKSAQLEILDAVYEPIGEDKREPGTFAVAYVQGKVLFAVVTRPGKDGNRVEMTLQDATLQTDVTREEIKSAVFTGSIKDSTLILEVEFADGDKKQWKLTQANGKEMWVNIDAEKMQKTIPEG